MQEFKAGDKINVIDGSWAFGIKDSKYTDYVAFKYREGLTVIQSELCVCRPESGYDVENCDLLVTDGGRNYFFVQSDLCESVDKKIEIRYFCDGKDVTDNISEETKRNL